MEAIVGTSGWQYRDWRGSVYPEDLPASRWLGWYAERFPSVEVNNTFYRLPERTTFERWADAVPDGFLFAVKASRFITHVRRLADVGSAVELLLTRARASAITSARSCSSSRRTCPARPIASSAAWPRCRRR